MIKSKQLPDLSDADIARFWSYVRTGGDDDCWPWIGYILDSGYGQFAIKNWPYRSHRVAYFIATGEDPKELHVLHSCDNRSCCNPKHFFKGTHLDNQRDKWAKGRGWVRKGEQCNFVKITEEIAAEARRRYDAGELVGAIASDLGLTYGNVMAIGRRQTWKDLLETTQRPTDPWRNTRGDNSFYRRFPGTAPRGEAVKTSKLKPDQVLEIRKQYAAGEPMSAIAVAFGVCQQNIKHIVTRISWKHLP